MRASQHIFFLFNVLPGDPARMMLDQREDSDQLQVLKAIKKVQPKAAGIGYELLARKTAENMNINLLLLGSYQIYGDKIQVTTKLVEVESGIVKPLIMETYSLDDPLSMQSDISDKISAILKSKNNSIN